MTVITGPWPGSGNEPARRVQPPPLLGLPLGHQATVTASDVTAGWCYQAQLDVLVVDSICSGCGQPVLWDDNHGGNGG